MHPNTRNKFAHPQPYFLYFYQNPIYYSPNKQIVHHPVASPVQKDTSSPCDILFYHSICETFPDKRLQYLYHAKRLSKHLHMRHIPLLTIYRTDYVLPNKIMKSFHSTLSPRAFEIAPMNSPHPIYAAQSHPVVI